MEFISPILRLDFREFCVGHLVLRQIHDIFRLAGVSRGKANTDYPLSGERRTLVEEYYSSINWLRRDDCLRFLKVLGLALAQTYLSEDERSSLQRLCEKEGLVVEGTQVRFPTGKPPERSSPSLAHDDLRDLKDALVKLSGVEAHIRGFEFERFLVQLFEAYGLAPRASFRLVGEQIDGSFELNGEVYLLEAKWQSKLTSQDDLLIFREKVEGKARWARGLFVSYSGFSEDEMAAFAHGRATNIIGMTSQDLYFILDEEMSLPESIARKARRAAETGEFYTSVFDLLRK